MLKRGILNTSCWYAFTVCFKVLFFQEIIHSNMFMCWRTIITKRQQIYYNVKFHCIFINRTHNQTLFRQFNFLFHLFTGCYTCHGYGHKAKYCTSTDEGKTAIKSPLYLSLLQKSMLIYCYPPFVLFDR